MTQSNNVKIVVFVPVTHADKVRDAVGKAGAGKIGNYTFCSFSSKGIGRFRPEQGANPTIGKVGKLELVEEERIEFVCSRAILQGVLKAMKEAHPYEEVAFDIYPLEDI
ncbi:MAG TPA: YqfO family protein [Candidatus Paceibacterota bacterium]|nr:YqfO family protein [Candidatus Paceibacterota bacterium]